MESENGGVVLQIIVRSDPGGDGDPSGFRDRIWS